MSIVKKFEQKGERTACSRTGEFYEVSSVYATSRRIPKDITKLIMGDIDELQGKPRRFFDMLLTMVEAQRSNDPLIKEGNRQEYWDYLVAGCEMWLSAIENGVYREVIKYSVPLTKEGKARKNEV